MTKETKLWLSRQLLYIHQYFVPIQYEAEKAFTWPIRRTMGRFMDYIYVKSEELWAEWYMEKHQDEGNTTD